MSASTFLETLEISRVMNAPVEKVFDAWTKPELLAMWFGPEGFEVREVEADCKPQGKYNITIVSPDNNVIQHYGEYLDVDKPNRIVFTWVLENQACEGSKGQCATTLVEITFTRQGDQTLLDLRHEKLPDQSALDGHSFGWQSSLASLENLLSK